MPAPRRQIVHTLLGAAVASGLACATSGPRTVGRDDSHPDAIELFRRARFAELARTDNGDATSWATRIKPDAVADGEDLADWNARVAYRRGDGAEARRALNGLGASSTTRRILTALLDNADLTHPLREASASRRVIELPLHPRALSLGFPVIEVRVNGRRFHMLWDTGATENVLSPAAVDELELTRTDVEFPVLRRHDGYVVRFAATATPELEIGAWTIKNVPWLVTDLDATSAQLLEDKTAHGTTSQRLDGFLSPQLLLPTGCFAIDRARAVLKIAFEARACRSLLATARDKSPVFTWNGEVYASARIHDSPELAVQLETGSPVTFLRADATRWLPKGSLDETLEAASGEIAHDLRAPVPFSVAGHTKRIGQIDLDARRRNEGHDEIATLGTDLLLSGRGVAVSFATMEMGFLDDRPDAPLANAQAGEEDESALR